MPPLFYTSFESTRESRWSVVSRLLHLTFLPVTLGFIRNFFPSISVKVVICVAQVNAQLCNNCGATGGVQPGLLIMSDQLKVLLRERIE